MTGTHPSCLEIAARVHARELSAKSVCDAALAAAERHQDSHHTFLKLCPETARRQAERVDALVGMGRRLPLSGVPFAVQDNIDAKGLPTSWGAGLYADRTASQDATVIRKLVSLGAVLIGKLNLLEGDLGTLTSVGSAPQRNPWSAAHAVGTTGSGAALAIALDICPLAIATDTSGSLRVSSAWCGVVGLKPTYGRISRAGTLPLAWSLDHVSPVARSIEDIALVMRMLAGQDAADPSSLRHPIPDYVEELKKPLDGVRLGVPTNWMADSVDAEVREGVRLAVEQWVSLGAQLTHVEVPLLKEVRAVHRVLLLAEAASYHLRFLQTHAAKYESRVRHLLLAGGCLSATDYLLAQRLRTEARTAWSKLFTECDVLVTPTVQTVAPPAERMASPSDGSAESQAHLNATLPLNVVGYPALTVPCGFSTQNLPLGLQLVGKALEEGLLLRVAHYYQQQTAWHTRRPNE